jgi:type II secretory pathway pseudopilin PulG
MWCGLQAGCSPFFCNRGKYDGHGVAAGFSLFELMVVLIVISLMGLVLLDRLLYYQEQAEKTAMEQTVTILRVALHMREGELMARGLDAQVTQLAMENPMSWLSPKPANYAGEINGTSANIPASSWYYDRRDQVLVYKVKHRRHLAEGGADKGEIRFRISGGSANNIKASPEIAVNNRMGSLLLQAVTPYTWF